MALQLHGNIKNYDFVRSAETEGEVEIQDSITHDVLYKKFRQTSTEAYRSQIIDPIPEVLLVEVEGKSSKAKLKKVLLYQPDDTLELKDTGILGFEHKFVWEGESYVWKRRNLGFSREIECKMVHGDDPGIGVAIFKPGKKTVGHMTIMYFNLERIRVNDKRGLEYVLLITMFSFLDKLEDENLGKKKNAVVSDSHEVVGDSHEVVEDKPKKKEKKKKKSSEKKEQMEKEKILAEENEAKKREMERREEERLRETEAKQQELLRKLKQEKEDQEYARKLLLLEEESYDYRKDKSNSTSHNPINQRPPRNGNYQDSTYDEHRTPPSSSTNSRHGDSTSTAYPPWESNHRNTYHGNPAAGTMVSPEDSSPPMTPPPKRTKRKPKEYKNEYGW